MAAWALITGATSGIGRAYARKLAALDYRLVLCGRRTAELVTLSSTLPGGPHEVLVGDLADPSARNRIVERLRTGSAPSIVISNAGFGNRERFSLSHMRDIDMMCDVHMTAAAAIASVALARLRTRREAAMREPLPPALIFVASLAAFLPAPGPALYTASKAFLVALARAIAPEAQLSGVRVQALCPGYTESEFHSRLGWEPQRRRSRGIVRWMSADEVVDGSLSALRRRGAEADPVVIPGWTNRLLLRLVRLVPGRLYRRMARTIGDD